MQPKNTITVMRWLGVSTHKSQRHVRELELREVRARALYLTGRAKLIFYPLFSRLTDRPGIVPGCGSNWPPNRGCTLCVSDIKISSFINLLKVNSGVIIRQLADNTMGSVLILIMNALGISADAALLFPFFLMGGICMGIVPWRCFVMKIGQKRSRLKCTAAFVKIVPMLKKILKRLIYSSIIYLFGPYQALATLKGAECTHFTGMEWHLEWI